MTEPIHRPKPFEVLREFQLESSVARTPMIWCVGMLAAGIFVCHGLGASIAAGACTLLASGGCIYLFRSVPVRKRLVLMGLSVASSGYLLASLQQPPDGDALSKFAQRASQPIAIRAMISSAATWRPNPNHRPEDPKSQAWRTRWEIELESAMVGDSWQPLSAHVGLSTDGRISNLLPGDHIKVWGSFRGVVPPTNPGEFDFAQAMRAKGQFCSIEANSVRQIERSGSTWAHPIARAQAWCSTVVDGWLQEFVGSSHAPLAAALVIGTREQVDWQQQEALMATGTLHLLAISGLHIEVVATLVTLLCISFQTRSRTQCFLPIIICLAYAVLAGGRPPVLRALLLVSTINIANYYGRESRTANTLAFAGFVLLLLRTAHLSNVGVQLSFIAVASLSLIQQEHLSKGRPARLAQLTDRGRSIASLAVYQLLRFVLASTRISSCVWLATCPLIWVNFHVLPWVAIPLNVVISIPLSVGLVAGLLTAAFGWCGSFAQWPGWVCQSSLEIVQLCVQFAFKIPWGHIWLPAPNPAWVVIYYTTCVVWLFWWNGRRLKCLAILLFALILCQVAVILLGVEVAGLAASSDSQEAMRSELRCTFLDVGHGTSVLLEMPNDEIWVYDAGQMGRPHRSFERTSNALWELGTANINTLVVSHADADHYNGVIGLMERFHIGRIASTPQFWRTQEHAAQETLRRIDALAVPKETWHGSRIPEEAMHGECGSVTWSVLHPDHRRQSPSDNANSLCMLIGYAGRNILLPGDLEGTGLTSLTSLPPRGIDVLMAPHHGSSTLDPTELLEWCRPRWTVISGNHRAVRQSVIDQYQGRTQHLAITFQEGAVQFRIQGDGGITCYHFTQGCWLPWE